MSEAPRYLSRREVLAGASLLPLAGLLPGLLREGPAAAAVAAPATYRSFDAHQAAVVTEASARLVPGPRDDLLELGHPGAREADVVRYIDTMLAAFSFDPAQVHAGGPWSNHNGNPTDPDFLAHFVKLDRVQAAAWKQRLAGLQAQYTAGIKQLDAAAGGDFAAAPALRQDLVLASSAVAPFMNLLFQHTIEGMYGIPEYGGNAGRVGWRDIGFPGDSQPRGYTAAEVERSDGLDVVDPLGILDTVVANFDKVAAALAARGWPGGR